VLKQSLTLLLLFVQCLLPRLGLTRPQEDRGLQNCNWHGSNTSLCLHRFLFTSMKFGLHDNHIVTDFINALPGNSSVNTAQHATIDDAVFYVVRTEQRRTTGLCNPLLGTGSVNTLPRIGPCYESGDVINNRDCAFRGVCTEYL
jgi:hypothetical protein